MIGTFVSRDGIPGPFSRYQRRPRSSIPSSTYSDFLYNFARRKILVDLQRSTGQSVEIPSCVIYKHQTTTRTIRVEYQEWRNLGSPTKYFPKRKREKCGEHDGCACNYQVQMIASLSLSVSVSLSLNRSPSMANLSSDEREQEHICGRTNLVPRAHQAFWNLSLSRAGCLVHQ